MCVCVARFWIEQQSSLYRSCAFEMPVATLSHRGCPPCSGTGTQGQQFSNYNGMLQSFAERWLFTQNYTRQDITELRRSCMLDNIVVVDTTKLGIRESRILLFPQKAHCRSAIRRLTVEAGRWERRRGEFLGGWRIPLRKCLAIHRFLDVSWEWTVLPASQWRTLPRRVASCIEV